MQSFSDIHSALNNHQPKQRDKEAERQSRRVRRKQRSLVSKKLTELEKAQLTLKGLILLREVNFSANSIRGQLLHAVLENAVYDSRYQTWVFDRSIRDLALDGLEDGAKHNLSYLLDCMADFVRLGILTRIRDKRGVPITYQVNVNV